MIIDLFKNGLRFQDRQGISLSLCLLFMIALSSCIQQIPFDTSQFEAELVVNGLLTPDSVMAVYVHATTPLGSVDWASVEDAVVFIRENISGDTTVLIHQGAGRYESNGQFPEIGGIYELNVHAGDLGKASAVDTMPRSPIVYGGNFESGTTFDSDGEPHLDVEIEFLNANSTPSFWELLIVTDYDNFPGASFMGLLFSPALPDPVLINEGDLDFLPKSYVFSNSLMDEGRYLFQMKLNQRVIRLAGLDQIPFPASYQNPATIFRQISQAYYLYQRAWIRHSYHQSTGARLQDPLQLLFSGEPTALYSNVEGAHGIFAAYTTTVSELQPK